MAKRTAICRVCGKQFVPCNKSSASLGAFNYHSIACSADCGAEYLRRVQEARKQPEQKETTMFTEQVDFVDVADVNVTGEVSENENEEAVEPMALAVYRSRKNKQETSEE